MRAGVSDGNRGLQAEEGVIQKPEQEIVDEIRARRRLPPRSSSIEPQPEPLLPKLPFPRSHVESQPKERQIKILER
jgi:hypothetical protein